jgi:hypothetical protein
MSLERSASRIGEISLALAFHGMNSLGVGAPIRILEQCGDATFKFQPFPQQHAGRARLTVACANLKTGSN